MIRTSGPKYYILEGHTPVVVDVTTWGRWFSDAEKRIVAQTDVGADCLVSTIFLGFDHNWSGEGPPLLFETMIFNGPFDEEMWRYATWAEAEKGHAEAVEKAETALA